jgi:protoporphyrinogen oxidase
MTRSNRFVIIGAGPTGLGAAAQLVAQGETSFVILEASDAPGGLARSFRDVNGFTWDLGSHLHYSHHRELEQLFLRGAGDW